ncbi:M15 family metallopeptidase [Cytobacillus purgationiresistens]|uniref:Peptidoglycan L-alanyl-D-glutamate endopeptidase CwlK n=1 Tax=Cytobacillus purgationiresistens TaxID=863449 RepID=A0ABU0AI30_9BACI|nr:M15 family metallopeptidase [Cytobacillus purgationiresistens]MDQ0269735.1 peptidoglycan L-alanyl-D-glutamate endopeptidase CwlK [Cytobacillus purgationiresistens]
MRVAKLLRLIVFLLIMFVVGLLVYQYIVFPEYEDALMPTNLHPVVAEKRDDLIVRAADKGITVVITDDFRSSEDQEALYEKGRTVEGNIVTNARGGESYHNFGLAIDFALLTVDGVLVWDMEYDGNGNGLSDWMEVVDIAKEIGFEWGGDWASFKDYPHFQYDYGLSIRDLQRGKRPPEQ